jgi:hypothetical protein
VSKIIDKIADVEPPRIEAFERLQIVSDKVLAVLLGSAFCFAVLVFFLIAGAL